MTRSIEDRLAAAGLPPLPRMAWLELDLDALTGNLAAIRRLTGPAAAIHPVVKADAYGHGALPIAQALEGAGADGFCVAVVDEGLALREGGIGAPIRVLYPAPPEFVVPAGRAGIALSVGDADGLARTLEAVRTARRSGALERDLGLEVEVDTGLGRGGVSPEAVVATVARIVGAEGVRAAGLWTHLQASEDAARTAVQLERFAAVRDALADAGLDPGPRHVMASGGALIGVGVFDGVRPGLSMYGLLPDELDGASLEAPARALAAALRPVMSLHARPVRVADVAVGDGVSYGPTWRATRPSRVATLPLGYGDGYARAYSNAADVLIRGQRVPVVGNVAMDAVMIDVTDVLGPPVTGDDEVVLLGAQGTERITAAELARRRTTIQWEVVTQMAARLPRVYHAASAPVDLRTLAGRRG